MKKLVGNLWNNWWEIIEIIKILRVGILWKKCKVKVGIIWNDGLRIIE